MSVSQVKKRFSEFESFLKKDKEGLRRLKLLKDDVNVLRTSLAAAEEKARQCEVIKNSARERADSAESERDTLRLEVHSLKQQVASLMTDLASATKPEEKELDKDDPDYLIQLGDDVQCKKMLKRLRRNLPQCPRLKHLGKNPVFIRQEIAEGFSYQSIWTLGASVAIIAAHEGSVTISDPVGVLFEHEKDLRCDGLAFNFIRWFGKNMNMDKATNRPISAHKEKAVTLAVDKKGDIDRTGDFLYGE